MLTQLGAMPSAGWRMTASCCSGSNGVPGAGSMRAIPFCSSAFCLIPITALAEAPFFIANPAEETNWNLQNDWLKNTLEKFDTLLRDYFVSEKPQKLGLPSVGYFADQLHLTSNYFGDLVKKETGKSAQEYIQAKIIDVAKERVFNLDKSVSEIAYELGFKYPQHFSRLFKQKVGSTPKEFRASIS